MTTRIVTCNSCGKRFKTSVRCFLCPDCRKRIELVYKAYCKLEKDPCAEKIEKALKSLVDYSKTMPQEKHRYGETKKRIDD